MPSTRHTTPLVLALLATTLSGTALPALAFEPEPITVGTQVGGTLSDGNAATYTIDLEADSFVVGQADQVSVDVVVRVFGPDDKLVGRFDGPAEGPEPFRFDANEAGTYRIEIEPFEGATGDYTLKITAAERIATDPAKRVDQLMLAFSGEDTPGVVVGVVKDGELVFAKGYGMANLTFGVPFTTDTVSNIGSTSKQFTAFAICLLDQRGELSLDADVRSYLPELPELGHAVTIRNLLTHTSGYREFLNYFALTGRQIQHGDWITRDEILQMLQRQTELQNVPGEEWNYNNSAFAMLTLIIERVTGTPFPRWMDENVFTPLGMDHTVVRAEPTQIIPNAASGYEIGPDSAFHEVPDLGGAMGAGAIYTTVGDLAKWINNLHTHTLGGEDIYTQMTTSFVLNNGKPTGYGLGLFLDEQGGLPRIQHGGADRAHRAMLEFFPTINAGVIALSNNSAFVGNDASKVAEAFFKDSMTFDTGAPVADAGDAGAESSTERTAVGPEEFDVVAGRYGFAEIPGFVLTISTDGDSLYGQATGQPRLSLEHTEGSTFKVAGEEIYIEFLIENGACPAIVLHQNGEHRADRIEDEPWAPDAQELARYTGRYFSEELETFYTLAVEDGKLVLRQRRFEVTLTPGEQHTFSGGFPVAEVKFAVDERGEVTGLLASNGRTRGLRFEKQD